MAPSAKLFCPASEAIIARPFVDCESGGIKRAVEVYWAGIKNASRTETTNPIPVHRCSSVRRAHNNCRFGNMPGRDTAPVCGVKLPGAAGRSKSTVLVSFCCTCLTFRFGPKQVELLFFGIRCQPKLKNHC